MMTKKHFKEIAFILQEHLKADFENSEPNNCEKLRERADKLINDFSDFCRADNPRFERETFKQAILCEGKK